MERDLQMTGRTGREGSGTGRGRLLLLVFALALILAGCEKKNEAAASYALGQRLSAFEAQEGEGTAPGFASELCVISGEESGDPAVTAEAAAVFPLNGGQALFHKNATARMDPASTTKIMTALLALKYGNLDDLVTVTDAVVITEAGSSMCGIKPGDTITMEQLLYGLMIPSGNDAANAIAVHMAGDIESFAGMMNEEAARLGATGTHFANANGLTDPDHYTTAYDLYLMFHEALRYEKFREIIGAHSYTADYTDGQGQKKTSSWSVGNLYMKGDRAAPDGLSVFGGKTGTTKAAGYCLVMGSRTGDGGEYVSVVMKADSRSGLYDNMTNLISKIVN